MSDKEKWQVLLDVAPVNWEQAVGLLSPEEQAHIENVLSGLAQRAAFLAEYLTVRHMGGGNKQAVKRANMVLRGVRRALGYSYPAAQQFNI